MLSRSTTIAVCFPILALSPLLLLSCSETERHRALTFFFDGVPPLGSKTTQFSEEQVSDPNTLPDPNAPPEIVWSIHPPQKDCVQCHGERKERTFSREVQLVAQVPQLCYQCHPDLYEPEGNVHGPVSVGVCTFCHEPHRTPNPSLLKQPVPDLCYGCHDAELVEFFDSKHAEPSFANCTQCHEAHVSETSSLLKKDWQETVSSEP